MTEPAARRIDHEAPIEVYMPTPDDSAEVNPDILRVLYYQLRVEDHTPDFSLFSTLDPNLRSDPGHVKDILTWQIHELHHAEQLAAVVAHLDPGYAGHTLDRRQQVDQKHWSSRYLKPAGVMALQASLGLDGLAAVVAAKGYLNELMTGYSYSLEIDIADQPLLTKTLTPIRRQEPIHANDLYLPIAREKLDGSRRAQRQTRFILKHSAVIVGEDFQGKGKADEVIRTLFLHPKAGDIAARIDARIAALPGMQGLTVMQDRIAAA